MKDVNRDQNEYEPAKNKRGVNDTELSEGCLHSQPSLNADIRAVGLCESTRPKSGAQNSLDDLAGTERSRQRQVGLQALINLHRGITRAKNLFAFAPFGQRSGKLSCHRAESLNRMIVESHKTQAASPLPQIWRK